MIQIVFFQYLIDHAGQFFLCVIFRLLAGLFVVVMAHSVGQLDAVQLVVVVVVVHLEVMELQVVVVQFLILHVCEFLQMFFYVPDKEGFQITDLRTTVYAQNFGITRKIWDKI